MWDGLTLEKDSFRRLAADEWTLRWEEALDLWHAVDVLVEERRGHPLRVRGAVQVTLQGGNLKKLERFVRTRGPFAHMANFYVVIAKYMEPEEVASQLSDMLDTYLTHTPVKPGFLQGIFLCKGKTWKPFDIQERIDKLRARANPAMSADRRKQGKIETLMTHGFRVRCAEDKRLYAAFDADAADRPFQEYLQNYRSRGGPSPIGLVVNFVAYEDDKKSKRALSVVFQLRARNP